MAAPASPEVAGVATSALQPSGPVAVSDKRKPARVDHLRLVDLFRPNQAISQKVFTTIFCLWTLLLLLVWITGNARILPSPLEVLQAFPNLWFNEGLGEQLYVSLSLNIEAIVIMALLSLSVAYLTVLPTVRPFAVFVSAGRFNGFVGLPLIFTLIFGNAHSVKIALLVYGMSVFTVPAIQKMIENISKEEFDHARTLRMGEWRVVWEVVILGRFDEVIEILRNNIAMGWMMLPMVEGMFKFEGGVGALLQNENKHFHLAAVYCIVILVGLGGLFQDYLIGVLKRIVCPFSNLGLERA